MQAEGPDGEANAGGIKCGGHSGWVGGVVERTDRDSPSCLQA